MTETKRRPRSWQEMREQEIQWLVERTGDGLETWNKRVLAELFGPKGEKLAPAPGLEPPTARDEEVQAAAPDIPLEGLPVPMPAAPGAAWIRVREALEVENRGRPYDPRDRRPALLIRLIPVASTLG